MKSVIAQGSTIAKAIEEALKKADMPQEFFIKLLEDAQPGFLGFGAKKAKIALFFKEQVVSAKHSESMFEKGSYENLFNNPAMKKQIEQQLKELGLEIKPISDMKKSNTDSARQSSNYSNQQNQSHQPKTYTRPLPDRSKKQHQDDHNSAQRNPLKINQSPVRDQIRPLRQQEDSQDEQSRTDGQRRRRRARYFRPRNRNQNNDASGERSTDFVNKFNSNDEQ